jgi:hypothetical protein
VRTRYRWRSTIALYSQQMPLQPEAVTGGSRRPNGANPERSRCNARVVDRRRYSCTCKCRHEGSFVILIGLHKTPMTALIKHVRAETSVLCRDDAKLIPYEELPCMGLGRWYEDTCLGPSKNGGVDPCLES